MKTLDTLIKLKNQELDEVRTKLMEFFKYIENLENSIKEIDKKLIKEKEFVSNNPEFNTQYYNFYHKSQSTKNIINDTIKKTRNDIQLLQEIIFQKFSELKKLEIIKEKKLQEIKEQNRKIENSKMDEISINMFLKKNNLS